MKNLILSGLIFSVFAINSFSSCNTSAAMYARSCSAMYDLYKKKYNLLKDYTRAFPDKKIKTCTPEGIKHAKEIAHEQAEEQCDYKVLDFTVDHTIGLACKNIYQEKKPFLFKSEYCKTHLLK